MKKIKIKNKNLIWIDLEMTGLDPDTCYILEIAIIITNFDLKYNNKNISLVIYQSEDKLSKMDNWNIMTHTRNGLLDKVRKSNLDEKKAENTILEYISKICEYKESPMCGNNISHDRKFLAKYMPKLENFFNYKHLDVNSVKEFIKIYNPNLMLNYKKKSIHRALYDTKESINELLFYKNKILDNK